MKSQTKKRTRRIIDPWVFPGTGWIEVDVDKYWLWLKSLPENELMNELCQGSTWRVIFEDFDESPEFREGFMKEFFKPEADRGRKKAIFGIAVMNNSLAELIEAARAYQKHSDSLMPDENGDCEISPLLAQDDGPVWGAELIAEKFAKLVCDSGLRNLAKQFTNLAATEKKRAERISEGHELYNDGLVWRSFCELVLSTKRIPKEDEMDVAIRRRWKKRSVDLSKMGGICESLGISRQIPTGNGK